MLGHILVGARQQQTPVGDIGVACPDLVAVDDVLVALTRCGGGQRRQVGPRTRLAEALAPPIGAVYHARQEALSYFLASVVAEGDDQVAEARTRGGARLGDLLVDDDVVDRRQILPAIFLRP